MAPEPLPGWVAKELSPRYGIEFPDVGDAFHGEESSGWRVGTANGAFAIQVYPAWRSDAEIAWVHAAVAAIHVRIPEAVAPLATTDGQTVVRAGGRLVSLFPFVDGLPLDDGDEALRIEAAALLARVHRAGRSIPMRPRPPASVSADAETRPPPDGPDLVDARLDAWEGGVERRRHLNGIIHGDYYSRNVLCHEGKILGVIDWMEMRLAPLVIEVGWVVWEFSQNDDGDDLELDRAAAFLEAYRSAGGPVPSDEDADLIPAIRHRLRAEVRASFSRDAGRGDAAETDAYREAEIRAFSRLRHVRLG